MIERIDLRRLRAGELEHGLHGFKKQWRGAGGFEQRAIRVVTRAGLFVLRERGDENVYALREREVIERSEDDADEGGLERRRHAGQTHRLITRTANDRLCLRRLSRPPSSASSSLRSMTSR